MHERKGFWDKNASRYDRFMRNDRAVQKSAVLKASFPLTYAECTKSEGPDVVL